MANIERYRGSSPMRDLFESNRRLNRFFDDAFRRFPLGLSDEDFGQEMIGAADVEELGDHYVISFDVPGIPKENINIEVTGNRLTVCGEREDVSRSRRGEGRSYGHFEQSLVLPGDIDASQVEAQCRDGVLRIAVPKAETMKSRKIEIGEKKEGFFSRMMEKVQGAVGGGEKKDQVPVNESGTGTKSTSKTRAA